MKLMAPTMLSAAIKRKYSSVLFVLSPFASFDEICGTITDFVFLSFE